MALETSSGSRPWVLQATPGLDASSGPHIENLPSDDKNLAMPSTAGAWGVQTPDYTRMSGGERCT
jgi:hypothetical protein